MPRRLELHEDRLFPADPTVRAIARALYGSVRDLPIISPHGHTDPAWFATTRPSPTPPICCSRQITTSIACSTARASRCDDLRRRRSRRARRSRSARGVATVRAALPSLQRHALVAVAQLRVPESVRFRASRSSEDTADPYFDGIGAALQRPEFRPRALFERFSIEVSRRPSRRTIRWTTTGRSARAAGTGA